MRSWNRGADCLRPALMKLKDTEVDYVRKSQHATYDRCVENRPSIVTHRSPLFLEEDFNVAISLTHASGQSNHCRHICQMTCNIGAVSKNSGGLNIPCSSLSFSHPCLPFPILFALLEISTYPHHLCCETIQQNWMRLKPISQLRFDYDTTKIRRYHDAFDYDGSDRDYGMRLIRLRYDYDTTTRKN